MSLDIHITTIEGDIIHIVMSEALHSEIFSSSTRWGSLKNIRKIKDYYKVDCLFKNKDAIAFIQELEDIKSRISAKKTELQEILNKVDNTKIIFIRVSGD
ncbi:hypothetical protein [Proteus mirabilis]|uniref:hypothetical protein n=1 Tax=Proteus mirabilis TaxID=584 RepID=UPI000F85BF65|nr:hypothetical protein [Proteus mirabilis]RUL09576.1 hypothetical protein ELP66_09670 [Proteus mirabilis]